MFQKTSHLLVTTGLLMFAASNVLAMDYQPGDFVIRAGLASVNPASDNGPTAEVEDAQGLGISVSYMLTNTIGVEVLGASPFNHDINLASNGQQIGETSQLPPTVLLNYHFPVSGPISAYVGAGINHTIFFEEKIDSAVAQDLDLDPSTGLALQLGTDFHVSDHWGLNLAWWYIDIDTDATLTASDGSKAKANVDIDPWVFVIGGSYRF